MTVEERFERIEHITAALAEGRRKDREEYKSLWRDRQKQIDEMSRNVNALAVETRLRIQEVGDRIDQLATESRAADQELRDRIASLVSAMGEFIGRLPQSH